MSEMNETRRIIAKEIRRVRGIARREGRAIPGDLEPTVEENGETRLLGPAEESIADLEWYLDQLDRKDHRREASWWASVERQDRRRAAELEAELSPSTRDGESVFTSASKDPDHDDQEDSPHAPS